MRVNGPGCGAGAAALGLAGELDPAGELVLRDLLAGRSPTGEAPHFRRVRSG